MVEDWPVAGLVSAGLVREPRAHEHVFVDPTTQTQEVRCHLVSCLHYGQNGVQSFGPISGVIPPVVGEKLITSGGGGKGKKIRQEIKAEHRNGTDSGLRKRCYHWNESQWSAVGGNQEEKQQQESTQEEIWSNIYVHLLITDEEKQTNRRRRRDDQTLLYSSCDYFLWFKTLI